MVCVVYTALLVCNYQIVNDRIRAMAVRTHEIIEMSNLMEENSGSIVVYPQIG